MNISTNNSTNNSTNDINHDQQDTGPSTADKFKVKAVQAIDYAKNNPDQVQNILLGAILAALTFGD